MQPQVLDKPSKQKNLMRRKRTKWRLHCCLECSTTYEVFIECLEARVRGTKRQKRTQDKSRGSAGLICISLIFWPLLITMNPTTTVIEFISTSPKGQ
jgi:hypothetical protein